MKHKQLTKRYLKHRIKRYKNAAELIKDMKNNKINHKWFWFDEGAINNG